MRRSFLAIVVSLLPLAVLGQGTTSRLVGSVADAQGAVVPGATVTLLNERTGVSYSTVTTRTGSYAFEAVQVGEYTVSIELAGFKKYVAKGNRVSIGVPTTVNAKLEVGGMAETVEVTGTAQAVQLSTSGNVGTVVQEREIQDLPIVGARGRNPLDLLNVQPGVVSGANTGGGVHVHGARDRSWNFTLDGIDTNESSAGGSNFTPLRPNPDSLTEFRVITANSTAEFGRNSGGQVTMVTRSGTNAFHGSLFYFYRTPALNANEWENNVNNIKEPQFVQHIPGLSIAGPIRKDKTFFFANIQMLRLRRSFNVTSTVYTQQARQGIWRYVAGGRNQPAGVSGASVDTNGNVLPGIPISSYSIPGNDPLGLGINSTIRQEVDRTLVPNNFNVGDGLNLAGYTFVAPEREEQMDAVIKIDHVLNRTNHVFARVAWGKQNTLCDSANGGLQRYPEGPCVVNTYRDPFNVALNWRWNPTSSVVNELVVGLNHFAFDFQIPSADATRPTFISTPVTLADSYDYGNMRTINTYQIVENLNWLRGSHSIKAGANIRITQHKDTRGSIGGQNASPYVDFSTGVNTVDPATYRIPGDINTTYDRPALQSAINFLLGRVGNIQQGFVQQGSAYAPGGTLFEFDARYPELDFYLQDTWKPRRNLTIDVGLRWELKLAPGNPDNLIRRPSPGVSVGQPATSSLRWETGDLYENDLNNLGPVVGFAWDPSGNGKTSIRGNYRLAYDRINTFVFSSAIFQSIPGITAQVTSTAYGQAGGRLPNLPTLQPTGKPEDFLQPPSVSANSMRVVDPSFQSPRTHGWVLSVQREILKGTIVEATYVGRKADHLFGAYNINQAEYRNNGFLEAFNVVKAGGQSPLMNQLLLADTRRQAGETGSDMVRRLYASTLTLNSVAGLASSLGTRIQSGRTLPELAGFGPYFFFPYPQYLGGLNVIDSGDWSRYDGLELKLERSFRNGFGYLVGYTLSRSKDTRSFDPAFTVVGTANAQSASSTPFDIYNRSLNYAYSDFDRRHAVQAFLVAELPFGSGKRFGGGADGLVNGLVGGWQLSALVRWFSGRPMTVYSGSNTFSSVVQTPANCSGCTGSEGEVHDEGGIVWYFNPAERAQFSNPAAGEFGSTGRNAFRGDDFLDIALGVQKRIRIRKGHELQLRADITNLTNSPSFGFPTLTLTSSTFGRIRDTVSSSSRKIQVAVKYTF
jgi:hypothetical protein